jgi:hypothetical protein
MPQAVTYAVNVKVENGPDIKSNAKLEAGSYSASVEELVCRGAPAVPVSVDVNLSQIEMLVITASAYANIVPVQI